MVTVLFWTKLVVVVYRFLRERGKAIVSYVLPSKNLWRDFFDAGVAVFLADSEKKSAIRLVVFVPVCDTTHSAKTEFFGKRKRERE